MSESQNIEYKESWRDEYIKWICGFANAQGGTLFIGKDDNGKNVGVANAKKLLEDIPNKIRDILGIVPDVNLLHQDGCDIIEITVEPSSFPISYKGEYHYRCGSTKQQLKGNALTQFLFKKTGLSWDASEVNNVELSSLSEVAFQIFRDRAIQSGRMNPEDVNIPNRELLEKLNLFTDSGKLTKAGYLLFAKDTEKRVIGSFIKIGFFEGSEIIYQDEVKGPLLEQAQKTVDIIFTKYLKAVISYQGVTRVETFPFAYAAIREAVYNAIVHRAYNCMNPTQIRVYADKIVISNDAALSADWTAEKFMSKHKSVRYNPLIANAFFFAGFIESWGRGIERMCNACKENGNPLPEFDISADDVTIVFPANNVAVEQRDLVNEPLNEPLNESLNEPLKSILEVIRKNPYFSKEVIAAETGKSRATITRALSKLQNDGIIKRVGSDKTGHWVVISDETRGGKDK